MESKKTNLTGAIASVILLIVFITASFAYFGMFTVNLENKVAVNIHASTIGNTSFIATSANLNVVVPKNGMFKGNTGLAAENTATLTVNLTGAPDVITTCTYDVVYEYNLDSEIYGSTVAVTSGATKEITLEVESPTGTNNYSSETNFAYDSTWSAKTDTVGAKKVLVKGASITSFGTSVVQNIDITGRYYNLDLNQSQLGDKSFTGTIYVENNNCTVGELPGYYTILANNGGINAIEAKGTPNFSSLATTNEGMYSAEDDYTSITGMKSYYFRGAVDNNWVKFGQVFDKDIYWRIIRINGDGSIRLLYTGTTAPTESQKVVMTGSGTQIISTSAFNSNYSSSEYVGYQYIQGQQHGNKKCDGANVSCLVNENTVYNSEIKQTIDTWYARTTLVNNNLVSQNQIFCNDRSASTSKTGPYGEIDSWASTGTEYYYGAYIRLDVNNKPQLVCPTISDRFTVNTSIGNGALTYPVGLLTADEVAMAGGGFYNWDNAKNKSYYLYTGQNYWTGTPFEFISGGSMAVVYSIYTDGTVTINTLEDDFGVRPVISLSPEAKLSGDGTWNNPYVVEG